jgi:hypothetical protein
VHGELLDEVIHDPPLLGRVAVVAERLELLKSASTLP